MENNIPYGILVQEGLEGVPYEDYIAVEGLHVLPEGFAENFMCYRYVNNKFVFDASLIRVYEPEFYSQTRAANYPTIGDQLDALFHAGAFNAEMTAQIQSVKDAFPKPS